MTSSKEKIFELDRYGHSSQDCVYRQEVGGRVREYQVLTILPVFVTHVNKDQDKFKGAMFSLALDEFDSSLHWLLNGIGNLLVFIALLLTALGLNWKFNFLPLWSIKFLAGFVDEDDNELQVTQEEEGEKLK